MRSRHVIAALAPVGAASALAILPIGASTAASTATAAVGHMTPEVSSPVAYTYVSKAGSLKGRSQAAVRSFGGNPD